MRSRIDPMSDVPLWKQMKDARVTSPPKILEYFGIRLPPVDVEAIAQQMDVVVYRTDMEESSGAIVSTVREAQIYVHYSDHPWRQRFTIAHELGHLMLQQPGFRHRDNPNFTGDWREVQANRFAAELLMPADMVGIGLISTGGDTRRLARLFNVSEAAMTVRLSVLNGR